MSADTDALREEIAAVLHVVNDFGESFGDEACRVGAEHSCYAGHLAYADAILPIIAQREQALRKQIERGIQALPCVGSTPAWWVQERAARVARGEGAT